MKFYEKPMAIIETIEVEDVITASNVAISDAENAALAAKAGADEVILFQW